MRPKLFTALSAGARSGWDDPRGRGIVRRVIRLRDVDGGAVHDDGRRGALLEAAQGRLGQGEAFLVPGHLAHALALQEL